MMHSPASTAFTQPGPMNSASQYAFTLIMNGQSGSVENEAMFAPLYREASPLKVVDLISLDPRFNLQHQMKAAVQDAQAKRRAILLAGGDGSINLALPYVLQYNVPMAVLPRGTFNLFARHHQIPCELDNALSHLSASRLTQVPVCWINDHPFVTSSSFGLYPDIIESREQHQALTGTRTRLTAWLSGIATFFAKRVSDRLILETEEDCFPVHSQLVLVSCNKPQLAHLELLDTLEVGRDHLSVVVIRAGKWKDKLRLFLRGTLGRLKQDRHIKVINTRMLTVHSHKARLKVAVDGEVRHVRTPVRLSIQPEALPLFLPAAPSL